MDEDTFRAAMSEPAFSRLPAHLQPTMRQAVLANPSEFNMGDIMWAQHGVTRATAEDVEAWERANRNPYDVDEDMNMGGDEYGLDSDEDDADDEGDEGGEDGDVRDGGQGARGIIVDDESRGSFMTDDSTSEDEEDDEKMRRLFNIRDTVPTPGNNSDDIEDDKQSCTLEKEVCEMLDLDTTECKDADDYHSLLLGGDAAAAKVGANDKDEGNAGRELDKGEKDSLVTDDEPIEIDDVAKDQEIIDAVMAHKIDNDGQDKKIDNAVQDQTIANTLAIPRDEDAVQAQKIDHAAQDQKIDDVANGQKIIGVDVTFLDVVDGVVEIPTIIPPTPCAPPCTTPPRELEGKVTGERDDDDAVKVDIAMKAGTGERDDDADGEDIAVKPDTGSTSGAISAPESDETKDNVDVKSFLVVNGGKKRTVWTGHVVDKGKGKGKGDADSTHALETGADGWPVGVDKDIRVETPPPVDASRHRCVIDASSMRHRCVIDDASMTHR